MDKNIQSEIDKKISVRLARINFWEFCLYYDKDFFTKRIFLKEVIDAFQNVYEGKIKRLSVSLPPRAGKSYIATLFCAWILAKKPDGSVMRNTCTATLYQKFSYDTRLVVRSDKFKEVFPQIILSSDKQNLDGWRLETSKQVAYFGAGVGGTIIGFGANLLAVTDDLYKSYEDAMSSNTIDFVASWKESTHDSRLESGCPQIDIGTRWTKKDIIGYNTELNRYDKSIVIPALSKDEDGQWKSFCEDVKTTDEYLQIKKEIDEVIFEAEYMQNPIELKGMLFNRNELKYFTPSDTLTQSFESSLSYADIADEGDDYLSMPIGKNIKENIYITDVVFNQLNADITLPICADKLKKNDVRYCRVESNSMGAMFARNLQKELITCQVLQAISTTNKHTRILMDSGFIKKYMYFLASEYQSDEYKKFMEQLFDYKKDGSSRHDDSADSLSGLAIFIRAILSKYY